MKIELKQIIDQLTDALNLDENQKVAAMVTDGEIVGWTVVDVAEDGTIAPADGNKFETLKGLLGFYY